MRLLVLWLFALLGPLAPLHAQDRSFLFEPQRFQAALTQLVKAAGGDPRLAGFVADDDEVVLVVRTEADPPRFAIWVVTDTVVLGLHTNKMTGPQPIDPARAKITADQLFGLADTPLDKVPDIVQRAARALPFEGRARSGSVVVRQPPGGTPGWEIELSTGWETAVVRTDAVGQILSSDITGTKKWQDRYFLTQDAWPFDQAARAFQEATGDGAIARRIVITPKDITLTATLPAQPGQVGTWVWDGGTGAATASGAPIAAADAPGFALTAADLARLPQIRQAAMAAVGPDAMITHQMRIVASPQGPLWEVQINVPGSFAKPKYETVVLTPDGMIVDQVSPEEQAALDDQTRPEAVIAGIAALRSALGDDAKVFDIYFRQDRISVTQPDPSDPEMTLSSALRETGLETGGPFPAMPMNQTEQDLFPLSILASVDAALVDSIRAKAVEALGIPQGAVYRMSLSSGAPFRRDSKGRPFFDVRVARPPNFNGGGYAVFTLDGDLVDAIK